MPKYNKTQLTPQHEFERHIYHRDQFAHYFRWSHVLKNAKIGQEILDYGCGSAEMLEVFYRNKYRPKRYVGLDIRSQEQNIEKWKKLDFAEFHQADLCQETLDLGTFDIITCFEVVEHIGHDNIDAFLENMLTYCKPETTIYLSTPNYDPQTGAAKNHILDGEIGEWDHFELQMVLDTYFHIARKWGTFASQKDYKAALEPWQHEAWKRLSEYYDTNLLSNLMAPMVDASLARNCLWVLQPREELL